MPKKGTKKDDVSKDGWILSNADTALLYPPNSTILREVIDGKKEKKDKKLKKHRFGNGNGEASAIKWRRLLKPKARPKAKSLVVTSSASSSSAKKMPRPPSTPPIRVPRPPTAPPPKVPKSPPAPPPPSMLGVAKGAAKGKSKGKLIQTTRCPGCWVCKGAAKVHAKLPVAKGAGFAMASYRWIVLAWSPRDGGWVHNFGYFKTEQDAWDCITQFQVLIQLHGDIEGFQVKRTIRF